MKTLALTCIFATFLYLLPLPGSCRDIPISQAIEEQLTAGNIGFVSDSDPLWPTLQDYYFKRRYKSIWFDKNGINKRGLILLETLSQAGTHGLNANDYFSNYLQRYHNAKNTSKDVWVELLLTKGLMLYIQHMRSGRFNPHDIGIDWHIEKPSVDVQEIINQLLINDDFKQALDSLPPQYPAYQRLRTALQNYLTLEARGEWPTIPDGPTLRLHDQSDRAAIVHHRLLAEGDMKTTIQRNKNRFDRTVELAVEHFQARHGLKIDGEVGPETRKEMNIPVRKRIEQIKLNLERWRWLPHDLGDQFLMANTAAYELTMFEHGKPLFTHRIITGMPTKQTPALAGAVHNVELNPYWYIPTSIAIKDMIPMQQKNPEYFKSMGIRIYHKNGTPPGEVDPGQVNWSIMTPAYFPYLLRQDPGPLNMMGKIKITFTDEYLLSLHDTPKKQLFNHDTRAFSSGCIRVENPIDLAAYLLRDDPNWTKRSLKQATDSLEFFSIELKTPVPIYLVYGTAGVGDDGDVYFRKDIYGWDTSQAQCQ